MALRCRAAGGTKTSSGATMLPRGVAHALRAAARPAPRGRAPLSARAESAAAPTALAEPAVKGPEPAGAAFSLGDDRNPAPAGATYAELRRQPVNYAPETRFTVDNAAEADARRFQLHPSVPFWRAWGTRMDTRSLGNNISASRASAESMSQEAFNLFAASAAADAESAAYWAYHLGRAGFFLATSAAGAFAHHLTEQAAGTGRRTPLQNLAANASAEVTNRIYEAIAMFQQDLANVKAGAYQLPWDMTTPTSRQLNPLFVARKAAAFVREAIGTLDRRLSEADTAPWFKSGMYPPYYMENTFHYQTDGWLSAKSAEIYEFSTEALFFGRQDAMQRTVLLALHEWLAETGRDPASLDLIEVACGTGRFHTFIKDNYPGMQTVASDLSPFYLSKARDNLADWKARRQPSADLGPGLARAGTAFMQCAAEAIPAADESFDAVVCVYLFHELPEEARIAAAREWARVLRPGGLVVLADSCQLGDRPAWDATLGAFGNFNEPHYRNYIACDMGALFEAAGLEPRTKYLASATKAWTFVKRPAGTAAAAAAAAAPSEAAAEAADAARAPEPGGDPQLN